MQVCINLLGIKLRQLHQPIIIRKLYNLRKFKIFLMGLIRLGKRSFIMSERIINLSQRSVDKKILIVDSPKIRIIIILLLKEVKAVRSKINPLIDKVNNINLKFSIYYRKGQTTDWPQPNQIIKVA